MPEPQDPPSSENYISFLIRSGKLDEYRVSFGQHFAGCLNTHARSILKWMSSLEAETWEESLEIMNAESPLYICGLARSGTTLLLESLNETGQFATHCYRDYPFIDIPILWNKWQALQPENKGQSRERAHFDGIMITPDSPEAFEEMIWMDFFKDSHNPEFSSVLNESTRNKKFEKYYKTHIQKILWIRNKKRYLAKGNYNLTRVAYLQSLFPDARFIIPVRDPAAHITSLIKQHALFCEIEKRDKRALKYMQWAGHHEFGLNRRPINPDNSDATRSVEKAWEDGREIEGWALYWDTLHRWVYNTITKNKTLKDRIKIVDFDTLCAAPEQELAAILDFCDVRLERPKIEALASRIKKPGYYKNAFTNEDLSIIKNTTQDTYRKLLGYK